MCVLPGSKEEGYKVPGVTTLRGSGIKTCILRAVFQNEENGRGSILKRGSLYNYSRTLIIKWLCSTPHWLEMDNIQVIIEQQYLFVFIRTGQSVIKGTFIRTNLQLCTDYVTTTTATKFSSDTLGAKNHFTDLVYNFRDAIIAGWMSNRCFQLLNGHKNTDRIVVFKSKHVYDNYRKTTRSC